MLATRQLIREPLLLPGQSDGIDAYSQRALARIWQAMRFSWSLTTMMHRFPGASEYDRRMQDTDLAQLERSGTAQVVALAALLLAAAPAHAQRPGAPRAPDSVVMTFAGDVAWPEGRPDMDRLTTR